MKYQEKQIEGFNLLITTEGNVLNLNTRKQRKPKLTRTGYLEIGMYNKETAKWMLIHRLVAINFIPNPENKPFVNHIDGVKTNNHVDNLEWVTHQENMEHAKNHNLIKRGSKNPVSKLNEDIVEEVCKLLQFGCRNKEIAETCHIPQYQVSLIRNKVVWEHISCKYVIPPRSRTFSEETIRWVWNKIQEGLTQSEIIALSDNKNINKNLIQDLRRGLYPDVTGMISRKTILKSK